MAKFGSNNSAKDYTGMNGCVEQLSVSDRFLHELADQYKTPFYLYQHSHLVTSWQALKSALTSRVDIFYSLKANPNLTISSELRALGAGAEVCSLVELEAALRAGFAPQNIIFVGPAKTSKEITRCLDVGVYAIVCESLRELRLIAELAAKRQQQASVMLRINPDFSNKNALLKMGGKSTQFGIDQDQILQYPEEFNKLSAINILGVHIYNGTRILDAAAIVANTANIFQLVEQLESKLHQQFVAVDIGGGFGVPYFSSESSLDLNLLTTTFPNVINEFIVKHPNTRIIAESGRFLVAPCGILVAKIIDLKVSKGENFIITDAGINCFMAAAGLTTPVIRNFPVYLCRQQPALLKNSSELQSYNVTGPLCTPGDLLARSVMLPAPAVGDCIVICRAGAYGLTASPGLFLSHGCPAEVFLKNHTHYLIRKRMSYEDFFSNQILMNSNGAVA